MILTNVRIKRLSAGLMITVILFMLCACDSEENTQEPTKSSETTGATEEVIYEEADFFSVINFYLSYLARSSYDTQGAFREYLHFEQDWARDILPGKENVVTCYEILEVKKLNDQLWVIHVSSTSAYEPEWYDYHNFVGLIDGKLYVMLNKFNVPAEIKEGLDLSEYNPGLIDYTEFQESMQGNYG